MSTCSKSQCGCVAPTTEHYILQNVRLQISHWRKKIIIQTMTSFAKGDYRSLRRLRAVWSKLSWSICRACQIFQPFEYLSFTITLWSKLRLFYFSYYLSGSGRRKLAHKELRERQMCISNIIAILMSPRSDNFDTSIERPCRDSGLFSTEDQELTTDNVGHTATRFPNSPGCSGDSVSPWRAGVNL